MNKTARCLLLALIPAAQAAAQQNACLRLNQVGYLPQQEKVLVVDNVKPGSRLLITDQQGRPVLRPKAKRKATSPWSKKTRYIVDFSKLTTPGLYTVSLDGQQAPLRIADHALHDVARASLKMFYYMRTAQTIEAEYAGSYARPAGHPDTDVLVHPSAASPLRPAGQRLASPLGWYDAGDYNKYIVNSAFSIGLMLSAYEENPDYFGRLKSGIPESSLPTPDLLDELMYNLRWMLTMQDPADGGVYHKLTTPNFEGFVMPADCHQPRYVVAKSVTATLDFAAVMAKTARVLRQMPDAYPGFALQAWRAATSAYAWAKAHPTEFYDQEAINARFDPDIHTGTYDDQDADDEFFWAATELFLLSGEEMYLKDALQHQPGEFQPPVWGQVAGLATFAWLGSANDDLRLQARQQLKAYADQLVARTATSCFHSPSGNVADDFAWGSLCERFCTPAIALLYADKYVSPGAYRLDALRNADYVLGRNALGYCFVTGFGQHSPQHPHMRLSVADGIDAPIPGMLVGGPNKGQQDASPSVLSYPSSLPDESYIDHEASYASNEIAINWNASLVALMGWLDSIF